MSELNDISEKKVINVKKKNDGSIFGCLTIIVGILLLIGFFILLCGGVPLLFTSLVVERSAFVPGGDASNFDPIVHFDAIQQHAGEDVKFVSMDVYYVRSDGTMDLYADYRPRAEFTFYRELSTPPDGAPPIGAGGSVNDRWYEEVDVDIARPWQMWNVTSGSTRYQYINFGMDQETNSAVTSPPGEVAPKPGCSFKRLWGAALERGAPAAAVATIRYNVSGYEFDIRDTDIDLRFDHDCQLERD